MSISSMSESGYSTFPTFKEKKNQGMPTKAVTNLDKFGLLGKHVYKSFVEGIPLNDSTCLKVSKNIFKGFLMTISSIGSVPLVGVSLKLAVENGWGNGWGYSLAAGNVISVANLNTRTILNVFKDKLMPKSPEGIELFATEKGFMANSKMLAILITSLVIGVASQTPQAYVSYYYDNKELLYPILTLIGCSSFPINSVKLALDSFFEQRGETPLENKLLLSKDFLINRLQNNAKRLLTIPEEERVAFFNEIKRINNLGELSSQMSEVLSHLLSNPINSGQSVSPYREYGRYIPKLIGCALTFTRLAVVAVTSYKAFEIFTNNVYACGAPAAFIVGCNALLTKNILIDSSVNMYDTTIDLFHGKKPATFSATFYPIVSTITKIFMTIIVAFSFATGYEVPHDNFSGGLRTFMEITYIMGGLVVFGSLLFQSTDDLIEKYSGWKGSEEEQQYLKFKDDTECLSSMIKNSPLKPLAQFVNLLPDDLFEECLYEAGYFKREELMSYANSSEEIELTANDYTAIELDEEA